ncbi:aldo/keto reductase [Aliikangiella marina]|uniref:Aldo/keto reductase n=1 Tax=Aliikangiella marina TaxID=1712262 RepID=A0A545T535_9GAMM|nr:aldo/keto reductase [Aliikangiella marina]TQV72341.1 aldo/keto reductase [Aliikangiella marina]
MTSRRDVIKWLTVAPWVAAAPPGLFANQARSSVSLAPSIFHKIPSTGERLPAIGMGSFQTFNVGDEPAAKQRLLEVLNTFFTMGGKLIDSSPMYGQSEAVIGELIGQLTPEPSLFAASKVWTNGRQEGISAIAETQRRMQVKKMDLMQVHNLRDWQVHLDTLDEYKSQGKIRYTGITTSRLGQYDDFERVMQSRKLDFVQLNYNIKVTEAEKRLLPLAQDKGIAVLVNRPFEKGRLFKAVKNKPLPDWAKEFDCHSWGQYFLKFIISHPAVTCAIPATSKVEHMKDNMLAMSGRLPDSSMRKKMLHYMESV